MKKLILIISSILLAAVLAVVVCHDIVLPGMWNYLVVNQDPDDIYEKFVTHAREHGYGDLTIQKIGVFYPSRTPITHPLGQAAVAAVRQGFGKEPLLLPCMGGSDPDYYFTRILGIPRVIIPYAPHDENNHARLLAAQALGQMKDPRAEKALLDALHEGNAPAIAGASLYFVFRGESGSEDALIETLNQYGDEQMANLFLNCGNPKLEAAARAWGHRRGWEMQQQVYGLMWGHEPTSSSPCEPDLDD